MATLSCLNMIQSSQLRRCLSLAFFFLITQCIPIAIWSYRMSMSRKGLFWAFVVNVLAIASLVWCVLQAPEDANTTFVWFVATACIAIVALKLNPFRSEL